jgi:UDP-glucose 4-epimerase
MRILVTGASGFAGRPLAVALAGQGHQVRAALRRAPEALPLSCETVPMPDMLQPFDAAPLVSGMDAVVHVAGLAHSSPHIPEADYNAINCDAARSLARGARVAKVSHFVLISSVRAQCGPSAEGTLSESDAPRPTDPYGRSKLAGEHAVAEELAGSGTALVILRPVLMYGPAAKGNMAALVHLARSPWPLPLGALPARRSLLGLANFCSAVAHVLHAPEAARGTFLVADGGALTAGDMIAAMRAGLGRKPGVFALPLPGVRQMLATMGKRDLTERLFGDLMVSTSALLRTGWRPPLTTAQGLAEGVRN